MPKPGLDKKQLEYFKKKLLEIRADILFDLKNMSTVNSAEAKDSGDEGGGHGLHLADVATDMYDKEFTLGLASNDKETLLKIEEALKRIEDKTYGICLKTKKPIKLARLKAIPYAEYSLAAQEEVENGSR